MRAPTYLLRYLLAFIGGAGFAVATLHFRGEHIDTNWRLVSTSDASKGIAFSEEVFVMADLPAPNFRKLDATVKFLETSELADRRVKLGYRVLAELDPVDVTKIPKKYLGEKKIKVGKQSITELPITEVTHEIYFDFTLTDKDGFRLLEIKGEPQLVESGKVNILQNIAAETIPSQIASRVTAISMKTVIDKCITCERE